MQREWEKHGEVFGAPDFLRGKRLPGAGGEGRLPTALAPHDAARVPRWEGVWGKCHTAGQAGVRPGHRCVVGESHKDTVLQGKGGSLPAEEKALQVGWDHSCGWKWPGAISLAGSCKH